MESVQISPCGFTCEREEGWKLGQSETATSKTDLLIFLTNKKLSAGTIYFRFLIYLKAIYEQNVKEIDFSTLATVDFSSPSLLKPWEEHVFKEI